MKKLFVAALMAVLLGAGCGVDQEAFANDSSILYAKIFEDGAQTAEVNALYDDYREKYADYEDDELYVEIVGMYNGLTNGTATDHQLEAMRLLNDMF